MNKAESEVRLPQVQEQLERLDKAIYIGHDVLNDLGVKLSPVSREFGESAYMTDIKDITVEAELVPIATSLKNMAFKLEELNRHITIITDNLEI